MKAEELRIGNLLSSPYEKVFKVKSIIEDESYGGHCILTGKNKTSLTVVRPIPLTEEWLLKFGFIKGRHSEWVGGIILEDKHQGIVYTGGEGVILSEPIKYVHQLQNLYFALTNKEL